MRAARIPIKAVPQPWPPMASMTLAATTLEKTSTEPMDRSMPDVMMTKVMPTPSTAQTATFCEISEKLEADRNLPPAATEKNATMTSRTPRIQTDWVFPRRFRRDWCPSSGSATATSSGFVMTLMPPLRSCPGRRSWRRRALRRWSPRPCRWPPGVPRRITCTRSATSSTCGMECEIRITAMPLSLTRLMLSRTFGSGRRPARPSVRRGSRPCRPS